MTFLYHQLTGTFWSFPLERFQAPREKESFVIDSVFIPIPNCQTQEADALQLRLARAVVSLGNCTCPSSHVNQSCSKLASMNVYSCASYETSRWSLRVYVLEPILSCNVRYKSAKISRSTKFLTQLSIQRCLPPFAT